ncbi:MAG: M20/M25/M40 family metallo-hydrolase [Methyloglobulus sp.]|nr:M20/M25/M40 family metallo-hydrolase [Methyloglobulus sp.]
MKNNTISVKKILPIAGVFNPPTPPRKHKSNTKLRSLGALLAAVFLIASIGTPAWADRKTDTERLRSAVEHGGIMKHLEALQKIANRNGGNRYVGTRGDLQTRNYIASVLTRAGFKNVQRLPVVFENFKEKTPAILELVSPTSKFYVNGLAGSPNAQFDIMQSSGNGDITANIQAVQIMDPPGPTPSSSDSGCDPAHFSSFVVGNIALIQRGTCTFSTKVANAIDAGAVGVIIFNEGQPGRTALIGALLSTPVSIPVVSAEWAVGKELYDLSLQGTVNVHMKTDAEYIHTETENIIAETSGRPDHVVMVGAHLDSVDEGPGIDDNGSGIGTLLEIAKGMQRLHIQPLNKVRFAFWGAEEEAQVGSGQYVNGLSDVDAGKIALYLNADMLGSPNFVPSVYEADYNVLPPAFASPPPAPGSIEIEQVLVDYFNGVGPSPKLLNIDQRSDYRFFLLNGIPFAAITSGFDGNKTDAEAVDFGGTAGEPYDACYHKKCDNIHNVSEDSLDLMSGALVHTIMEFAKRDVIFP